MPWEIGTAALPRPDSRGPTRGLGGRPLTVGPEGQVVGVVAQSYVPLDNVIAPRVAIDSFWLRGRGSLLSLLEPGDRTGPLLQLRQHPLGPFNIEHGRCHLVGPGRIQLMLADFETPLLPIRRSGPALTSQASTGSLGLVHPGNEGVVVPGPKVLPVCRRPGHRVLPQGVPDRLSGEDPLVGGPRPQLPLGFHLGIHDVPLVHEEPGPGLLRRLRRVGTGVRGPPHPASHDRNLAINYQVCPDLPRIHFCAEP